MGLAARTWAAVWFDEVYFIEPAVNLASGNGFVWAVWPGQPRGEFFVGNMPLHALALGAWLSWAGFGRDAVIAFNSGVTGAGCLLFWMAARAANGFGGSERRLLWLSGLLGSSGLFSAAAFGRYDPVVVFVAGALVLAVTLERWWLTAAVAAFIPWAGLHLAVVTGTISLMATVSGRKWRALAAAALAGLVLGMAALLVVYAANGVLPRFFQALDMHRNTGVGWMNTHGGWFDPSLITALLLASWFAVRPAGTKLHLTVGGLASAIFIGLLLSLLGRFSIYYAWMALLPAWAGLVAAGAPRWTLLLLHAWWVPALGVAWWLAPFRPLHVVDRVVRETIEPHDIVMTVPAAYYAAKSVAKLTLSDSYLPALSQDERRAISVVIAGPDEALKILPLLQGKWAEVARVLPSHRPCSIGPYHPLIYRLVIFRRTSD
jgi:hypothetical protein